LYIEIAENMTDPLFELKDKCIIMKINMTFKTDDAENRTQEPGTASMPSLGIELIS
jgi:hypothetical protein